MFWDLGEAEACHTNITFDELCFRCRGDAVSSLWSKQRGSTGGRLLTVGTQGCTEWAEECRQGRLAGR